MQYEDTATPLEEDEQKRDAYYCGKCYKVTETVGNLLDEFEREKTNLFSRKRYHKECLLTKDDFRMCKGECCNCDYHLSTKTTSLETPIDGEDGETTLGDILPSASPPLEDLAFNEALAEAINTTIKDRLDKVEKEVVTLLMQGFTEKEIAVIMGKTQSTVSYRKKQAFSKMREGLKKFKP